MRLGKEDGQRPAEPPPAPDDPRALALQLQRTAGNQATARMLQRFSVADLIVGPGLRAGFEWIVWKRVVRTNIESASFQTIPTQWRELAFLYSRENPQGRGSAPGSRGCPTSGSAAGNGPVSEIGDGGRVASSASLIGSGGLGCFASSSAFFWRHAAKRSSIAEACCSWAIEW